VRSIEDIHQTRREMAAFNRELAEIEDRLDSPRRRYANEKYTPKNYPELTKKH
jgi:hypothetical protein